MKTILLAAVITGVAVIPAQATITWDEIIAIAEKIPGAAHHKTCVDETCNFALVYTSSNDGVIHAIDEEYVSNVLD
ncbi:MAG: hypothetical protein M3178_02790 [Pseudomonadota bacterium]|nr:hypothetical protein [Pseudomonadota bacterium]